jgi:hypothetical protein
MSEENPGKNIDKKNKKPPRVRHVVKIPRADLKFHGLVEDTNQIALEAASTERPTVRLEDLNFPELDDEAQEELPSLEERREFKRINKAIMRLLDLISEPIALFGSHALFVWKEGKSKIPADSDIATTPKGAYELREALRGRDDVIITIEPYIHNPDGPLKAIRFAGKIEVGNKVHEFEVFGEGGVYGGEEFKGLFRLGDPSVRPKAVITKKLIRAGFLLDSYEKLINEIERNHPSGKLEGGKWEHRRTRIAELKRDLLSPKILDRDELRETLE